MTRRLKVFEARIGFYDTVVAASSRPAALQAWGVQQDLFREGQARESDDAAAIEAAKAKPQVVLRRPAGGKGPFELSPAALADPPRATRAKGSPSSRRTEAARHRAKQPDPAAADRRRLDRAQHALAELDARQAAEAAALEAKRSALEAQIRNVRDAHAERRRKAMAAVADARKAYRRSGGKP